VPILQFLKQALVHSGRCHYQGGRRFVGRQNTIVPWFIIHHITTACYYLCTSRISSGSSSVVDYFHFTIISECGDSIIIIISTRVIFIIIVTILTTICIVVIIINANDTTTTNFTLLLYNWMDRGYQWSDVVVHSVVYQQYHNLRRKINSLVHRLHFRQHLF
jgi:hypothetical protein